MLEDRANAIEILSKPLLRSGVHRVLHETIAISSPLAVYADPIERLPGCSTIPVGRAVALRDLDGVQRFP